MSKIGNHRIEIQETDDYKFGWQSADRGEPSPPRFETTAGMDGRRFLAQKAGWDDYHNQERSL